MTMALIYAVALAAESHPFSTRRLLSTQFKMLTVSLRRKNAGLGWTTTVMCMVCCGLCSDCGSTSRIAYCTVRAQTHPHHIHATPHTRALDRLWPHRDRICCALRCRRSCSSIERHVAVHRGRDPAMGREHGPQQRLAAPLAASDKTDKSTSSDGVRASCIASVSHSTPGSTRALLTAPCSPSCAATRLSLRPDVMATAA